MRNLYVFLLVFLFISCNKESNKEDRIVESVGDTDWMIQLDNELPITLTERTYIPKETYHRVIKGNGDLTVKVKKIYD